MLTFLKKLRRDERGVSALEYAILAAVVVGGILLAAEAVDFSTIFDGVQDLVDKANTLPTAGS